MDFEFRKRVLTYKIAFLGLLLCGLNVVKAQQFAIETSYSNPVRFGTGVSSTFLHQNKVGVSVNYSFATNFSLLSGVYYSLAYGEKWQGYPNDDYVSTNTFAQYADVPLKLMFSLPVSNTFKFFAFAGPSLNFGIYQKQFTLSTLGTQSSSISDVYASNLLSRWNVQLGAGGGIQWKKFIVKGGYDFGLTNLDLTKTYVINQSGWYATLGYELEVLKPKEKVKAVETE
jgi:Outer membrane protein beta-barrel domain